MATSAAAIEAHLEVVVAKDLLRRGYKVQGAARRHLSGTSGHPRRIDTGALRSDIGVRLTTYAGTPAVRIGTGLRYAIWVHDGTGIYGPLHHMIYPKTAKALVWRSKTYGAKKGKFAGKVVVHSVKGMKPNRFLADALIAAKD